MFRTLSIIAMIAASAASGAVITASTTCGSTTATDSCNTGDASASVSLHYQTVYTNTFGFNAGESTFGTATASVFFQDSYNFTINSGAGGGTFEICWFADSDPGAASFSFGSASGAVSGRHGSAGGCPGNGVNNVALIPFTDGVTQTFVVTLSASGGSFARTAQDQTGADVVVQTPLFFDVNGKQLSNVSFVLSSTSAPEPATGCLVGLAFAAYGWRKLRR